MRRRRPHPVRSPATALTDAELLDVLLGVLARTGGLDLADAVPAILAAERRKLRAQLVVIEHALRSSASACPSGAA